MNKLNWSFDNGTWQAVSAIHDDGSAFTWTIDVSDDGQFSLNNTSVELLPNRLPWFSTLADAKAYCEDHEREYVHAALAETK